MIRNRMTKPQDKAGNLLKPKNSRESRLFLGFTRLAALSCGFVIRLPIILSG